MHPNGDIFGYLRLCGRGHPGALRQNGEINNWSLRESGDGDCGSGNGAAMCLLCGLERLID